MAWKTHRRVGKMTDENRSFRANQAVSQRDSIINYILTFSLLFCTVFSLFLSGNFHISEVDFIVGKRYVSAFFTISLQMSGQGMTKRRKGEVIGMFLLAPPPSLKKIRFSIFDFSFSNSKKRKFSAFGHFVFFFQMRF